jgi:hypothetical protein
MYDPTYEAYILQSTSAQGHDEKTKYAALLLQRVTAINTSLTFKFNIMAKYGKKAGDKVERAMHEMHEGKLKSGRSGKKVTSRKQAVAIGLSEAREEGGKVPKKKAAAKKAAPKKKAAAKKAAPKKAAAKKAAPKKKAAEKKAAPKKKAAAKKAAPRKKAAAKKAAPKKSGKRR